MKRTLAILLLLSLITGGIFAKGKQEGAMLIDIPALEKLITGGDLVILDIRDMASYAEGHIPGAVLLPFSGVDIAAQTLKEVGVPIIAYCACPAEESSMAAALKLRGLGVDGVHVLVGGYIDWLEKGKPVVRGPNPF
ncbi:MAG: rhodanese-like domain-containing protein [Spirochaetales bacterium]|jgi:rhodanese-related sulfurtransferase|nr:rhodanese-like domain-containing protein [Spirochaetales bacterium]